MSTLHARIHARCLIPGLLFLWGVMTSPTFVAGQDASPLATPFEPPVVTPAQPPFKPPTQSILEPIPVGKPQPIDTRLFDTAPMNAAPADAAPMNTAPMNAAPTDAAPASSECLNLLESDGSFATGPHERIVDGELTDGDFVDGEYVDGQYVDGEYVDGELVDGQYFDNGGDEAVYCGESYCGSPSQYWMRFDYLLWWTSGSRLPPLVTTSPADQPPGVLGDADTTVLFGDEQVHRDARSNFRATMGYWVDCTHQFAFEGDYFDLGTETTRYSDWSVGDPVLTRPFFDVEQGYIRAVQSIAYPVGVVAGLGSVGSVDVTASDYFHSAGAALRRNVRYHSDACEVGGMACGDGGYEVDRVRSFRLDMVAGYRRYRLGDRLRIDERIISTAQDSLILPGTVFELSDRFRTDNEFNGAEFGLIAQIHRGRWSFEFLTKMAVGENRQTVWIRGQTDVTEPGSPTVSHAGGLLAMPSNSGTFRGGNLVVIPQFGAEVGFRVSDRLRAYVGYNLLLWAHVGRAGDQIDMNVNLSQASSQPRVGSAEPAFVFHDSNFWAQGLNVGGEFCF